MRGRVPSRSARLDAVDACYAGVLLLLLLVTAVAYAALAAAA
jgi:hypothetical protein